MNYKKRYVNPKIRKLKPKKKIWKKPFFWIVIVFIVAISSFCFVLFYPAIQISDIEISGNQKIKTQDIENEVMSLVNKKLINLGFLNVSSKSILLASTGNIENKITENFPEVKSVQVKKEFLNKIIVSIEERGAIAVFCNSSTDCFLLDRDGVVFEKAMQIPDDLPVLSKQYFEIGVSLGDNVIPKETVDLIYKVQHNLKDDLNIDIKEVLVSNPIIFKTSEGWSIYFDPDLSADSQITKMNILLKNEISAEERNNIQYIYLQYKDRAYYK